MALYKFYLLTYLIFCSYTQFFLTVATEIAEGKLPTVCSASTQPPTLSGMGKLLADGLRGEGCVGGGTSVSVGCTVSPIIR